MSTFSFPYIGTAQFEGADPNDPILQNATALAQRAQTALSNNQNFLAITNPTNAQAVAQVKALTRQMDGVIRFLLGQFDSIADS